MESESDAKLADEMTEAYDRLETVQYKIFFMRDFFCNAGNYELDDPDLRLISNNGASSRKRTICVER